MDDTIPLDSIQAIAASFGASFDAEKIVDTVEEKDGTRYYKVRWVKYSWEPTSSFVNLEHLIQDFWLQLGQSIPPDKKLQRKANTLVLNNPLKERDEISTILSALQTQRLVEPLQFITPLRNLVQPETLLNKNTELPSLLPPSSIQQSSTEEKKEEEEKKKRRKIPGKCHICGKQFKSTTNIAAHRKLHTEEKQFSCDECGKKFRRKLHLTRHLQSHAGVKSFVCEICNRAFTSKWYMEAHAVIHTGAKPFECDVCKKKFNNKANLNKHQKTHDEKRPFACNVCGMAFRQNYDLRRHSITHENPKQFSCTHCAKTFARKSYLTRHLLIHVKNCIICKEEFPNQVLFIEHLSKTPECDKALLSTTKDISQQIIPEENPHVDKVDFQCLSVKNLTIEEEKDDDILDGNVGNNAELNVGNVGNSSTDKISETKKDVSLEDLCVPDTNEKPTNSELLTENRNNEFDKDLSFIEEW